MKLVVTVIKPFWLGQIDDETIFVLGVQTAARIRGGDIDAAAI